MSEEKKNPRQEEPSLSELLQIRRAKLRELQDAGEDPFQQTRYPVNAHSTEIQENFEAMEGQVQARHGQSHVLRPAGRTGPHPDLCPH